MKIISRPWIGSKFRTPNSREYVVAEKVMYEFGKLMVDSANQHLYRREVAVEELVMVDDSYVLREPTK